MHPIPQICPQFVLVLVSLVARRNEHCPMPLTRMRCTKIHPLWRQYTIGIPAQRDSDGLGAFGANGCRTKAIDATNFEVVFNVIIIHVFEFVGARI
jgi:hypothetical protein